ncbi:undecaprenyldiphospho-muramoylpentapeptide beta-N-acetylglucosaminyltransferase [Granulicella pectinivorans]|nr:undecaprenyldiphospho-muramoylpentapeptide beta-N-acetylglucosaminyltransferase [Granulicella pectinivorans]
MRVLMAGGGTGGHVIPAVAIAREMRDVYGAEVRFVGTARGIETRLVPEAGFPLELIHVGQLANVSLGTRLRTYADLPLGLMRCVGLLRSFKPDVVVGVGGYASGPAMMAAVLLRVPTLAYEANAVPGMVNRVLGKYVSGAAVAYESTAAYFRKAVVTGVPVREAIFAVTPRPVGAAPRLLVTAGSNGARVFNEFMPEIVPALLERIPGLTVVHQSGKSSFEKTLALYEASGADASRWRVASFLEDMPGEYQAADLVLARAGSTVAELAAAGRPSLLVPFPQAADDHQAKNALVLAEAGAAVMLAQGGLTDSALLEELVRLLGDPARMRAMGEKARGLAKPGALRKIGEMVNGLAA